MNRRNLIARITTVALGISAFRSSVVNVQANAGSPHADAISLVIKTQQKEMAVGEQKYFKEKGVDWWRGEFEQYRWHDTIMRTWSVARPVAPGVVDSTHWFSVSYSINATVVCRWSVDTSKNKVELQDVNLPF